MHRHDNEHKDAALFRKPVPASLAVELSGLAVLGFSHSSGNHSCCKVNAHENDERHQRRIPAAEQGCNSAADCADHRTDTSFHVVTSSTLTARIIGCVLSVTAFQAR